MKVVINKCYGGFGLSEVAMCRLIGCPHIKLMEPKEYYGGREGWEKRFADESEKTALFRVVGYEGKVVLDEHRSESRDCPQLVSVVEELGNEANGTFAELHVVEIPNGVEWAIEEYDGIEWVAEVHRTWS